MSATTHTPGFLAWLQAFSALIPVDIQIEMCNNYAWIYRAAGATVSLKESATMLKVEREMQTVFIPVKQAIAAPELREALQNTWEHLFATGKIDELPDALVEQIESALRKANNSH